MLKGNKVWEVISSLYSPISVEHNLKIHFDILNPLARLPHHKKPPHQFSKIRSVWELSIKMDPYTFLEYFIWRVVDSHDEKMD